jgi:hypothetical protein
MSRVKDYQRPGIPVVFSGPYVDDRGDQYFVHSDTGEKHYVRVPTPDYAAIREREQQRRQRPLDLGHRRFPEPVPTKAEKKANRKQERATRYERDDWWAPRKDVERPLAAAEWIEGSEPVE